MIEMMSNMVLAHPSSHILDTLSIRRYDPAACWLLALVSHLGTSEMCHHPP